jgi:hypothetical protein
VPVELGAGVKLSKSLFRRRAWVRRFLKSPCSLLSNGREDRAVAELFICAFYTRPSLLVTGNARDTGTKSIRMVPGSAQDVGMNHMNYATFTPQASPPNLENDNLPALASVLRQRRESASRA